MVSFNLPYRTINNQLNMKNLFAIIMLGIALVLSSCGKDDDKTPKAPAWQKVWVTDNIDEPDSPFVINLKADNKLGYGLLVNEMLLKTLKSGMDEFPEAMQDIVKNLKVNDCLMVNGTYSVQETDATSGTLTLTLTIGEKSQSQVFKYQELTDTSVTISMNEESLVFKTPEALGLTLGKEYEGVDFLGRE